MGEFRDRNACVELRCIELDRAQLADAAKRWDSPLAAYLARQYATT